MFAAGKLPGFIGLQAVVLMAEDMLTHLAAHDLSMFPVMERYITSRKCSLANTRQTLRLMEAASAHLSISPCQSRPSWPVAVRGPMSARSLRVHRWPGRRGGAAGMDAGVSSRGRVCH